MKSFLVRSLGTLIALSAIFVLSVTLVPNTASAAAITVTALTATSSNSSASDAKLGDSVNYLLTVGGGDPLILPRINIFSLGSTTMTKTSTGSYTYSTTTNASNIWSQGLVTFQISVGQDTLVATATTTVVAVTSGSNVTYDTIAPSNPTGPADANFRGSISVTLTSAGSTQIRYTIDGTTPTCSSGTIYSSGVTITGSNTLKAVGCDAASNLSSVVTAVYSRSVLMQYSPSASTPAVQATPATSVETTTLSVLATPATSTTPATLATLTETPATPVVFASGLSATHVQSILDVLASFDADAATIASMKASLEGTTTGSVTSVAVRVFKSNLTTGSLGSEVKALQQFLNAHGYPVTSSGPGSFGNETMNFGPATKAALIKYQKAKGITPAAGYFGPKTRTAINSNQ